MAEMIKIYESTSPQLIYTYQKEIGSVLFGLIRSNRIAQFFVDPESGRIFYELQKRKLISNKIQEKEATLNAATIIVKNLAERLDIFLHANNLNNDEFPNLFKDRNLTLDSIRPVRTSGRVITSWIYRMIPEVSINEKYKIPLKGEYFEFEFADLVLLKLDYCYLPITKSGQSELFYIQEPYGDLNNIEYRRILSTKLLPYFLTYRGELPACKESIARTFYEPLNFPKSIPFSSASIDHFLNVKVTKTRNLTTFQPGSASVQIQGEYRLINVGMGNIPKSERIDLQRISNLFKRGNLTGSKSLKLKLLPSRYRSMLGLSAQEEIDSQKRDNAGNQIFYDYDLTSVEYSLKVIINSNETLWSAVEWMMKNPVARNIVFSEFDFPELISIAEQLNSYNHFLNSPAEANGRKYMSEEILAAKTAIREFSYMRALVYGIEVYLNDNSSKLNGADLILNSPVYTWVWGDIYLREVLRVNAINIYPDKGSIDKISKRPCIDLRSAFEPEFYEAVNRIATIFEFVLVNRNDFEQMKSGEYSSAAKTMSFMDAGRCIYLNPFLYGDSASLIFKWNLLRPEEPLFHAIANSLSSGNEISGDTGSEQVRSFIPVGKGRKFPTINDTKSILSDSINLSDLKD